MNEEASLTSAEASVGSTDKLHRKTSSIGGLDGEATASSSVWGTEGKMSMELSLNVRSLTVTFNKPDHPLARGNVSSLTAQLELNKGNMKICGSLGQASLTDLTEYGAFYRERYILGSLTIHLSKLCFPLPCQSTAWP